MRILIASDKFKGSLTSNEANEAITAGFRKHTGESIELKCLPIADGGDGLVSTLVSALGGTLETISVKGPLGEQVQARVGFTPDGKTALLEMAEASGIALVDPGQLDPDRASTFGTGELIRFAEKKGCTNIILGIGGSASNDGGTGMALALGFRFLDSSNKEITNLPEKLGKVHRIIAPDSNINVEIQIACDVTNPLLGPNGCTRIYGPQKGISPNDFPKHEARLEKLVSLFGENGAAAAEKPGAGAAGGLGFGGLVFMNARLVSGFDLVADLLGIRDAIARADLVITGEGSLDKQSLLGKGPGEIARIAKAHAKPVIAFCGRHDGTAPPSLFDEVVEIRDPGLTLEENLRGGKSRLETIAAEFASRYFSN